MKSVLLLSLFLILPIHAMESQEDDQCTQFLMQSRKRHIDNKRYASSFKKKVIATGVAALLATAGVVSNAVAIQKNFEPTHYQALPWMGAPLPANNETCTYVARTTETWFNNGNRNDCFVGRMRVPAQYCSCPSTHCPVIIQKCQEKDPLKQEVITTSSISLITLITGWLASTFGIWCID
jgi:hypothetical protein